MIAKLFEIKQTTTKGKGLFAKEFIRKGTMIGFTCKYCQKVSKKKFEKLSRKEQDRIYYEAEHPFRERDGTIVTPCDEAGYLNHSCNAKILDSGKGFDIVVMDIEIGEEATYDYRCFGDEDFTLKCLCNEDNCCKTIKFQQPIPKELSSFWENKLTAALSLTKQVHQPLSNELLEMSNKFKKYLS